MLAIDQLHLRNRIIASDAQDAPSAKPWLEQRKGSTVDAACL
ncbi:MAG: hypothetical protein AB7V13_04625 [Pseudorhodoplanes sp.]